MVSVCPVGHHSPRVTVDSGKWGSPLQSCKVPTTADSPGINPGLPFTNFVTLQKLPNLFESVCSSAKWVSLRNPASQCLALGQLSPELVTFWKFLCLPQHTHTHTHISTSTHRVTHSGPPWVSKKSIIDFLFKNLYVIFLIENFKHFR